MTARAWVIVDSVSGEILHSYNHNIKREIASITKLMTTYVVLELCKKMNVQMNTTYAEVS